MVLLMLPLFAFLGCKEKEVGSQSPLNLVVRLTAPKDVNPLDVSEVYVKTFVLGRRIA